MVRGEKAVKKQMLSLGVREEDIVELFVRSGGPGGQKVNKAATCVFLKHLPTGLEVKSQEARSQRVNRIRARAILLEKIAEQRKRREELKRRRIEKARRQKRKRPRAVKEKILEQKRRHSRKKKLRSRVKSDEW